MKKKQEEREFSCGCDTLKSLLDTLASQDITDFSKVEFELSYGSCYYEGDSPSIVAVYTP